VSLPTVTVDKLGRFKWAGHVDRSQIRSPVTILTELPRFPTYISYRHRGRRSFYIIRKIRRKYLRSNFVSGRETKRSNGCQLREFIT
jgi:hypothetical protein